MNKTLKIILIAVAVLIAVYFGYTAWQKAQAAASKNELSN